MIVCAKRPNVTGKIIVHARATVGYPATECRAPNSTVVTDARTGPAGFRADLDQGTGWLNITGIVRRRPIAVACACDVIRDLSSE